jgi:hypothetical protein
VPDEHLKVLKENNMKFTGLVGKSLDCAAAGLLLTGLIAAATVWGRVNCRKRENFGANDCLGNANTVIVTGIKSRRVDNHWQMPAAWCGRIAVSVLSDK